MSRHSIASFSERFEVTVGWDRPLNSYFAQVEHLDAAEDEDPIVVWVGASFCEIQSPEVLQPYIASFATIPAEILATLHNDRAETLDRGDSQLQRELRRIVYRR